MVTRENYEVYFIDYLDDNLDPDGVEMLLLFLKQNPDLAEELNGLQEITLSHSDTIYELKDKLKKAGFSKNGISKEFDYLCIAERENDITEDEKKHLNLFITEEPFRKSQREIYSKIELKPDEGILFTNKISLRRTPVLHIRQSQFRNLLSMAAGIVLFFGIFTVFNLTQSTNHDLVSQLNDPVVEEKADVKESVSTTENIGEHKQSTEPLLQANQNIVETDPVLVNPEILMVEKQDESIALSSIKPIAFKQIQLQTQGNPMLKPIENYALAVSENQEPLTEYNQKPQSVHNSRTIGLFDVVQYGVKKFADATGTDLQLNAEKDQSGKLTRIQFESTLFALSTPVRKK